jgi:hypothetical protein
MLRLDKVVKPWKESAALNDHINLYGFWNETAFLTKSGDLGMVLQVQGVDYESLMPERKAGSRRSCQESRKSSFVGALFTLLFLVLVRLEKTHYGLFEGTR